MPASGMRDCPFCAEPVRIAAVLCPHCRSDLPPFKYAKPKRYGTVGTILFWLLLGSLGVYAWSTFEHQSKPSPSASRTETGYCTAARYDKDRVTMAFAFGSGVLQNLPEEQGFGVLVNDAYWARMNYRARVDFMRSLDCAIAGPGKALAIPTCARKGVARSLQNGREGNLTPLSFPAMSHRTIRMAPVAEVRREGAVSLTELAREWQVRGVRVKRLVEVLAGFPNFRAALYSA